MKDMDENMKNFQSTGNSSADDETFNQSTSKTSPKGDYIDFEEIK
jgi:hypothetical protein